MKPLYRFEPCGLDAWDPHETTPARGALVQVTGAPGLGRLQRPFAYVESPEGTFYGMVNRASLVRISVKDVPSWKAGAYGRGERSPSFNALRFATRKEAAAYASDLFGRWFGCDRVEVFPSTDPVNYVWDGRAWPLKNPEKAIPVTPEGQAFL